MNNPATVHEIIRVVNTCNARKVKIWNMNFDLLYSGNIDFIPEGLKNRNYCESYRHAGIIEIRVY